MYYILIDFVTFSFLRDYGALLSLLSDSHYSSLWSKNFNLHVPKPNKESHSYFHSLTQEVWPNRIPFGHFIIPEFYK